MPPLSGLKVIDFTTLLPGPLATLMLAEAGAEVTKIERPQGEDMRRLGTQWHGVSALFALLNAGKRSITADLTSERDRATVLRLIDGADVLVEQFRPGVMARFGLDHERVRARNPRLVYCSITGYGQTGPLAQRAGHDLNYVGETGVLALNPGPPGAPQVPPVLAADIAGGAYPALINILLALRERERTGSGAHLDIAMAEGMFPFAFWALPATALGFGEPRPGAELLTGGSPRYRLYATADDKLLAVAALEDRFWSLFCEAIELPHELRLPDASAERVAAVVARIVAARPARHWQAVFERVDCCCSIVRSLAEALAAPQFKGRGLFDYRIEWCGDRLPALPLPIAPAFRAPPDKARRLARLGEYDEATSGNDCG